MPPSSGNDLDAHLDQLVEAARIRLDGHDKTEEGIRLKGAAFWKIQHEDGLYARETARRARERLQAEGFTKSRTRSWEHRHDNKQTVATFLIGWLERKTEDGAMRPSTERGYRRHVEKYLVPVIGHVRLQDLRPGHIDILA